MRTSAISRPSPRRTISALLAVASATALAALGFQAPAQAAPSKPAAPAASSAKTAQPAFEPACGPAEAGQFSCFALRRTNAKPLKGITPAAVTPDGFGPADLQSAYGLPSDGGAGQTVAIVDAFDDPTAEADLAVYRAQFGLPECTTANGCFTKVDQRGGTDYPVPDAGWAGEISLDLDMVSAIAPYAHILLVEADDNSFENLGESVNEAVALGAKFVSNSYGTDYRGGGGEDPSETTAFDPYYNHPGVAVVASSGDYGYGVGYPAASPYVTAVGGTSLVRDTGSPRGWSESAWSGAGSGCSLYEPKPAFQHDSGCANRAEADVSAVSDNNTPVAVYQTYGAGGWNQYGGTSVASPIIASVYAVAGTPAAGSYPNSYPYAAGTGINDVTTGSNGSCSPSYLCNGTAGYDGPTGLGTPNGLAAFRSGPHGQVSGSVTDTATGEAISGATVTVGGNVAHTSAAGTYSLTVPSGTYDVTVDAFGYASKTVQGVAVDDGSALTENFALSAVASQTVSGKVTDGSGHGWGLYAKITVDGAPGSVWTDPATGSYDLSLPEGHTYTLHVTPSNAGYQAVSKTITVASSALSLNVAVPADPWASAPSGYAVHVTGTTEPFDATDSAPQGWSVVNAEGTNGGWEFDDPGNRTNRTGGTGAFAIADSDHVGGGASQDSSLVSPVYDLTGKSAPELAFQTEYKSYGSQTAEVEATADGGATWTKIWSAGQDITGPQKIEVPLTDFAGKSAVQLRFHFASSFGWWWSVDDVFIGNRDLTATPGGLVVGTVSDANTGTGTVGATVTGTGSETATTVATPDDPELGDGYYSLFTAGLGNHSFTAAKSHYASQAKTVKVLADSAVRTNFSLKAGQLKVTPASVNATVAWGGSTSQALKVKNTGGAPATLKIGEQSGGFQIQAKGAPLKTVKGDFSPLNSKAAKAKTGNVVAPAAGPSDSAWQSAPDFSQDIMDNAAGTYDGKVYSAFGFTGTADSKDMYVLDPVAGSWSKLASAADTRESPAHGFIDGKFYVAGGWGGNALPDPKTEIYDPATDSWSTGASAPNPYAGAGTAVLDGKLYMIGGCTDVCGTTDASAYDAASNTWSTIASYPETIAWESCGAIGGKLYCAGGLNASNADVSHSYVYDPSEDSWSPVADMPAGQWASAYSAANGQLLVSSGVSNNALTNRGFAFDPQSGTWSSLPNANVPTYRSGAGVGFYKVGGGNAPGSPIATVELLPGYDQGGSSDVTWLSESAQELTLQPGASATVTVSLDASVPEVTQPGDFTAQLALGSDTPYSLTAVPVTMHVNPPKTWGKITGTVLGATTTGGTAPLAGATVQINSWASSYSLTTTADGTYALWLDTRNNPLTVIVAKDGYQPTVTTVKLTKGATVTSNFTLKRK